ncbi:hypothetical protein PVAP13_4KG250500 [Panicum virgatum]|nr:hypothetical protein PVAP13_4KG250500 [Panicum virgatum]
MSIKSIKPLEAGYSFDGQRFDHVGGDAGVPPRLLRRLRVHGARERRRCRVWQGEHDGAVRGGGGARRRGEVPGAHRQVQADPRCVRSSCSSRHLMLLIATVRNPFIVEYNDSWVEKGCYVCIIIGYCEGRDVRIVREETCMYVLEKSASGLCSFSWLFIICMLDRDVKCSNIFIARDQSIRLARSKVASATSAMKSVFWQEVQQKDEEETNCTFEKRGAAWMAFLHEGVMVERLCFKMLRPTQVSRWTCTMDVMFFQLSMPMKFSETCGHYIVIFLFLHISSMHVMLVPVNFLTYLFDIKTKTYSMCGIV